MGFSNFRTCLTLVPTHYTSSSHRHKIIIKDVFPENCVVCVRRNYGQYRLLVYRIFDFYSPVRRTNNNNINRHKFG